MTTRPSCATCAHWSPWLPGLGECLEPVKSWQEAFVRADDVAAFKAANPPVSALDTEATHTCDRWAAEDVYA